jgi:hypothetical protein
MSGRDQEWSNDSIHRAAIEEGQWKIISLWNNEERDAFYKSLEAGF